MFQIIYTRNSNSVNFLAILLLLLMSSCKCKEKIEDKLLLAIQKGNEEYVAQLINDNNINVKNLYFHSIYSPLSIACTNRKTNIVKLLLKKGANVDAINKKSGATPLMETIDYGFDDIKIIQYLLESGANPNLKDFDGDNSLIKACWDSDDKRYFKVIDLLIKHNADIESTDSEMRTPLLIAVDTENIELLFKLLKYKVDINTNDINNKTALDYAKQKNNQKIIQLLRKHGAKTAAELKAEKKTEKTKTPDKPKPAPQPEPK